MEVHFQRLLAIALGGAAGAVCRYALVLVCVQMLGPRFPIGVLLANVAGCFLIGLMMHDSLLRADQFGEVIQPAIVVGFFGALTTFSTFGYDTLYLWDLGRRLAAVTNMVASCGLGLAACWLGRSAGNALWQN